MMRRGQKNETFRMSGIEGRPAGLTVIELTIVVIIIGIIIGLVVKGQVLVVRGQMKQLVKQKQDIAAAVSGYYDRFAYLAGDDPNASSRYSGATKGNGNGRVGVGSSVTAPDFRCTGTGTEQCDLWFELRQANLLGGTGFTNPRHVFNGNVALTYNAPGKAGAGHWLAFEGVPSDACRGLDKAYDDGIWNTGSIQGASDYDTASDGNFTLFFRL
ncbi:MAG: hypothetical protein A4E60_03440 [Syntrophorhabdus sp. PtaB.Bin047]|nr:MAG: hypothetical protein A4E60_03440 [Syntrophorhabdus sp. PtaB.Bin047]